MTSRKIGEDLSNFLRQSVNFSKEIALIIQEEKIMSQKDFRNELKRIFTDYKRITPQIESGLQRLGILIGRKKNHVILFISTERGRHSVSISSTGSDKREGLNIVSKIARLKFC